MKASSELGPVVCVVQNPVLQRWRLHVGEGTYQDVSRV